MAHEDLIGKYIHWVAKPEDFIPPTGDPADCICGANGNPDTGRLLIPNCPCCDGIQVFSQEICDCPKGTHTVKFKSYIPKDTKMRIRYIDNAEVIS